MYPRTLVIIAAAMLVGALVLRFLVFQFGWLPVSEEVVLKKAIALKVTYVDPIGIPIANPNGNMAGGAKVLPNKGPGMAPIGIPLMQKSIWIEDPAEVSALLAALHVKDFSDEGRYPGLSITRRPPSGPTPHIDIEFKFNETQSRTHSFDGGRLLGPYVVNKEFQEELRKIVKKHVGHDIDVNRLMLDDGGNKN